MRLKVLYSGLVVLALLLAGCSDSGDDGDPDTHCDDGHVDDECPATSTPTTTPPTSTPPTSSTPPTPNELPIVGLVITNETGAEVDYTVEGGSLTFDASSSMDPDGTIEAAAITISDNNGTRAPVQLFKNGKFTPATFKFDKAGVVHVGIGVQDDRGAIVQFVGNAYVNEVIEPSGHQFRAVNPLQEADACEGVTENGQADIADPQYYKQFGFEVREGAQWVEATVLGGEISIAICAPRIDGAGNPISDAATDRVESTEGANLTASSDYYVAAVNTGAPATGLVQIVVHYEPRAAAA